MLLPRAQVIHQEREVVAAIVGIDRLAPVADQVQFLLLPEPEPRAGEAEGRARDRFKLERLPVKLATLVQVPDVQGHMIQFFEFHCAATVRLRVVAADIMSIRPVRPSLFFGLGASEWSPSACGPLTTSSGEPAPARCV